VPPRIALLLVFALAAPLPAAEFPAFRMQELDPHVGNVCYAVTTADVDGNGKLDVVAVTEEAVVWFANPGWEKHVLIKGATPGATTSASSPTTSTATARSTSPWARAGSRPTPSRAVPSSGSAGPDPATPPGRSCRSAPSPRCTGFRWATCWAPASRSSSSRRSRGGGPGGPNWGRGVVG